MHFATVTATYPDAAGTTGRVTLTPLTDVCDGRVTVLARPTTLSVVRGTASALVETTGHSEYRVEERIDGTPPRSWVCSMPAGAVDLHALRSQLERSDLAA